jgi:hypothetical protein
MLRSFLILLFLAPLSAGPCAALAQGFAPITAKADFLAQVADRKLQLGLFDLSITVKSDGSITGTALGWPVTGDWIWQDNLFCRNMNWGGMDIDYNCQLVEIDTNRVRFTADGGQGRSASFTLD